MNNEVKKAIISLSLFTSLLTMAGCGKEAECDIEGSHIHKYKSNQGIERYIEGESESTYSFGSNTYYRTDDYITLDEESEKIYKVVSDKSLVGIEDNKSLLFDISDNLKDYYEFKYYYYETEYHTHYYTDGDGKQHSYTTSEEVKKYKWTTDPDHRNLTGDKRIITHVFYGYNVVKGENGNYTVIEGGPVDDIRLLIEMGYKYVDNSIYHEMEREDYLYKIGLYGHVSDEDLRPVYVIEDDEYILYDEYVLKR